MPRVNLTLSAGAYEELQNLSKSLDIGMNDVVRNALRLYWYVKRPAEKVEKLLIVTIDKEGNEVVQHLLVP